MTRETAQLQQQLKQAEQVATVAKQEQYIAAASLVSAQEQVDQLHAANSAFQQKHASLVQSKAIDTTTAATTTRVWWLLSRLDLLLQLLLCCIYLMSSA